MKCGFWNIPLFVKLIYFITKPIIVITNKLCIMQGHLLMLTQRFETSKVLLIILIEWCKGALDFIIRVTCFDGLRSLYGTTHFVRSLESKLHI